MANKVGDALKKKHLAITLSKLIPHPQTNVNLEQYSTHGDLASDWIFAIAQYNDFSDQTVVDLGSGNGILGIGAYYAGASKIIMLEAAEDAHDAARKNTKSLEFPERFELHNRKLSDFTTDWSKVDMIISNPPWGYQKERSDRLFIEVGMKNGVPEIHILHSDKAGHIEKIANHFGYEAEVILEGEFILPLTYMHHSKNSSVTQFKAWRLTKND